VTKPHQLGFSVSEPGPSSFAFRFNFRNASRFICGFIWECFLNTLASPCRSDGSGGDAANQVVVFSVPADYGIRGCIGVFSGSLAWNGAWVGVIAHRPKLADDVGPQLVEVTPDRKAVSALRDWANPGPATSYSGLGRPQRSGNARGIATRSRCFIRTGRPLLASPCWAARRGSRPAPYRRRPVGAPRPTCRPRTAPPARRRARRWPAQAGSA